MPRTLTPRLRPHPLGLMALLAPLALLASVSVVRPAQACGWDWETYHAEAKAMPCVFDALLGFWPKHTDEYHRTRIEAAEQALDWLPGWTPALDAKALSHMKLGELEAAETVMKQRLALAPDAYPSHANLGTLYTFTGGFAPALEHIDRALVIEPEAHFGREKYHRSLVVFLGRIGEDPAIASQENFLGLTLTDHQRINGSPAIYRSLGLDDDAFDALVAMITVYGADELAEIYLTLGELLAAHGDRRLAYTAFRRAKELGHVRGKELKGWMKALDKAIEGEAPHRGRGGERTYRSIAENYVFELRHAKEFQTKWGEWERERLGEGLAIWSQAGLDEVYARMDAKRRRCDVPRIIADPNAPLGGPANDDDDANDEHGEDQSDEALEP